LAGKNGCKNASSKVSGGGVMAKKKVKAEEPTDLHKKYRESFPLFEALRQEVVFILESSLTAREIKIHQVESRVKTIDSISQNVSSDKYSSLGEVTDIVGARIICLFKSDLHNVIDIIEREFEVLSIDNKVDSADDVFGYMSIHVLAVMKSEYSGPRYNKIRGQIFEVQIRTLCMHAWAAISHYLDYKAEWDIPEHLRKSLNALSGLFYVADSQYEQIYNNRQDSKNIVLQESKNEDSDQGINYDTVHAMLRRLFPERKEAPSVVMSNFVKELIDNGYTDISSIEADIGKSFDQIAKQEEQNKKSMKITRVGPYFIDVGAARIALGETNKGYKQLNQVKSGR
jgi:ppGpp synthetase/RelA/SpoT-type nucleotidyltranferase